MAVKYHCKAASSNLALNIQQIESLFTNITPVQSKNLIWPLC